MEFTYTLRAADGKEYGPVTLVQIVAWVHEGRAGEFSEIRRSDMDRWAMARDFAELKFLFAASEPVPAPDAPQTIAPPPGAQQNAALLSQMKSGASWFYWIAGLSLVNSVSALAFNKTLHLVVGLGITQAIDLFGVNGSNRDRVIAAGLNLLLIGAMGILGIGAYKGKLRLFVLGFLIYAIDAVSLVTFLWVGRWVEAGIHCVALFFIFRGMQACRALRA